MRLVPVGLAALFAAGLLSLAASVGLATAATSRVTITESNGGYAFEPTTITVAAGDTVTWTNDSDAVHFLESDDGSFGIDQLDEGASFSHRLMSAGTAPYHCNIHPSMRGTVVVLAAVVTPPPTDTEVAPPTLGGSNRGSLVVIALGAALIAAVFVVRPRSEPAAILPGGTELDRSLGGRLER